jgi:hypothetical protein
VTVSSNWLNIDSILKQVPDHLGEDDYIKPLNIICESCNKLTPKNWLARTYIKKYIIIFLKNRAQLYQFVSQHNLAKVKRPIIVLGLPRSGTTYLYNLLHQDSLNRSPKTWEVASPFSPYAGNKLKIFSRKLKISISIFLLKLLAGDFSHIHSVGADMPEEDTIINLLSLRSILFLFIGNTRQYADYLQQCDPEPIMLWHARFLQYLQSQQYTERWLLKAPGHVQLIQSLSDTYPEACFINIRRDPLVSFASLCGFADFLQTNLYVKVDHKELGQIMLKYWSSALKHLQQYRVGKDAHRLFAVEYQDFIESPVETIKSIYNNFDIEYTAEFEANIDKYLAKDKKERKQLKKHQYSLSKYGLTEEEVLEKIVL